MASLGIFHWNKNNKSGLDASIASFRKFHPDIPYFVSVDGGSESQLTPSNTEQLVIHLQEVTYLYVKDICAYVKKTFRVHYTISGMTKWLQHNYFRYKKPHAVPAKAETEPERLVTVPERVEIFVVFVETVPARVTTEPWVLFTDP